MMMKILYLFCLLLYSAGTVAQTTDFMSGFEDLPLMQGLIQQDDASISFDTPSGRIIEAYAESPSLSKNKIVAFYSQTLPQLGWKKSKKQTNLSYARDGEILEIVIESGLPIKVRFELTTQE